MLGLRNGAFFSRWGFSCVLMHYYYCCPFAFNLDSCSKLVILWLYSRITRGAFTISWCPGLLRETDLIGQGWDLDINIVFKSPPTRWF